MKLVKMSLAAAVLLSASAFALDNVKVDTSVSVLYGTNDMDYVRDPNTGIVKNGLFDQPTSYGDAGIKIGVTGDIMKNVQFGATAYGVTSLNLEQEVVSNTWTGAHTLTGTPSVDEASWLGELWVAATYGKTIAKVGRMELDTPLAFSEKWSIVPNTFEAAVLINQDLPDTTLVGAWVAKGNGTNTLGANGLLAKVPNTSGLGVDGIMAADGKFSRFAYDGAYAAGLVNNSFKPLVAQAWYYSVDEVANAYWLQGDMDCQLVKGVKLGAQYGVMSPKGMTQSVLDAIGTPANGLNADTEAYALKLSYEVDKLKVSAAYSEVDADGLLKMSNVATNNLGAAQSKLYTEAWWNYGYVGAPGAEAYNVTAEYDAGFAKLGAYYTDAEVQRTGQLIATDMNELTVTASKAFGPLSATVAYIMTDADDQNLDINGQGQKYNSLQAYLTLNF